MAHDLLFLYTCFAPLVDDEIVNLSQRYAVLNGLIGRQSTAVSALRLLTNPGRIEYPNREDNVTQISLNTETFVYKTNEEMTEFFKEIPSTATSLVLTGSALTEKQARAILPALILTNITKLFFLSYHLSDGLIIEFDDMLQYNQRKIIMNGDSGLQLLCALSLKKHGIFQEYTPQYLQDCMPNIQNNYLI